MNRDKAVVVIVDGTQETGLGHAVRVANILAQLDCRAQIVFGRGEALSAIFPGAELHRSGDVMLAIDFANACNAAVVLIDRADSGSLDWVDIHSRAQTALVAIDDYGGPLRADLVINGTILPKYHHYPLIESANVCCGAKYTLIHPAFGQGVWQGTLSKRVTIVAGGGARAHDWAFALAQQGDLFRLEDKPVLVVGRSYPDYDLLVEACRKSKITLHRGITSIELASVLAESRTAVVTGGMIVYECLALGVPTLAWPQELNLVDEIAWLARQDALVDLDYHDGVDIGVVASGMHALAGDPLRLDALSRRGRALFDGKGIIRAAARITQTMDTARA